MDRTNKIYQNDIGLAVVCNVHADISNALEVKLLVRKPGGEEVEWDGWVHEANGKSQYVKYLTQEGDLDKRGRYMVQPYIEIPGWKGRGETDEFRVEAPFR